jgi:hypothetical protein
VNCQTVGHYGTGWSKSHATHIKIFIDGCGSIQFNWINKHTISLWLYKTPRRSRHVVTCSCQSSFNSRSARMSFSQVQWVFIVKHYLASHSYLTCQNEFRDTFPDSPVPNKLTISHGEPFLSLQKLFIGLHQTWEKECMHASLNVVDISNTSYNIVFVSWFQCNLVFDKRNMCQEWDVWLFDHPVYTHVTLAGLNSSKHWNDTTHHTFFKD